jgi:glyoxylase-like metal-dependent hydrolase (beta-lactamase superfamily II)
MRSPLQFFLQAGVLPALVISNLACTSARGPDHRLVDRAAEALGGSDGIRSVRALTMDGEGEIFALGQSRTVDGPVLKWMVTGYHRTVDFDRGRWRDTSTRTPAFVTGWPAPFPVVAGYDDDVAYDVEEGQASRLDGITARDRRAEVYHHPIGFLRAALGPGARVLGARAEGGQDAVDLILTNGERFTLYADRATHLPQRIVSQTYVAPLGDVTVETTFGDFVDAGSTAAAPAGGTKVPSRITTRFDGTVVLDLRITKTVVNPAADARGDLQAPADARAAPASRPARVTVDEAAPGVWYLAGEGHHSVVAEFADHLTLIEAPVDDARTLAVIAAARTLRPSKPLTQVINTHHHFDHSGGIRAAIAEGLTVITHEANRQFYEQVAKRPATVAPDRLATQPKPLRIETVSTQKTLTDGVRRLEIHPITDSPHSASMLMVYFPNEKLLVEADAYQPPPLAGVPPRLHPFAANLLDNVRARRLRVDRVLPLHGRIVAFAELVAAAGTPPQGTR